jgi:hypothetical protein
LEPSFTVAVTDRKTAPKTRNFRELREDLERRQRAKRPHKYVNGGVMCQICGLDPRAAIHI